MDQQTYVKAQELESQISRLKNMEQSLSRVAEAGTLKSISVSLFVHYNERSSHDISFTPKLIQTLFNYLRDEAKLLEEEAAKLQKEFDAL